MPPLIPMNAVDDSLLQQAWDRTRNIFGLVRFSHAVFALPFALVSLLVATPGLPSGGFLIRIIIAVLLARNAAMTFNRLLDHRLDAENPRTQGRHLVTGAISRGFAWFFFVANCLGFFLIAFTFNRFCTLLALPTLGVLCFYSVTKRFTGFSHVFLGLALSLAPLGTWAAVRGSVDATPFFLAAAVLFWVCGFDIIYATQDEAVDRRLGLFSAVSRLGRGKALWLARLAHAIVVPALIAFGLQSALLGVFFFLACGMIALLLIYEHALIRPGGDLQRVNDAFFRVNGLISLLLLVSTCLDLIHQGQFFS